MIKIIEYEPKKTQQRAREQAAKEHRSHTPQGRLWARKLRKKTWILVWRNPGAGVMYHATMYHDRNNGAK